MAPYKREVEVGRRGQGQGRAEQSRGGQGEPSLCIPWKVSKGGPVCSAAQVSPSPQGKPLLLSHMKLKPSFLHWNLSQTCPEPSACFFLPGGPVSPPSFLSPPTAVSLALGNGQPSPSHASAASYMQLSWTLSWLHRALGSL